jgi:DNA-binding SARP family transcriptional activator/WD40 repeat protein
VATVLRIRVLGVAGINDAPELAPRDRRVLAALVVMSGRFCTADRLAAALYGDQDPPASWRKVVQGAVMRLRAVLGADGIESSANGYRLAIPDDEIDARLFERQLREAEVASARDDGERAAVLYSDALKLFSGEPLVDLDGWEPGRAEAARLGELRLLAEERRVDALLESGQHQDAVSLAAGLVEEQPLREQRWATLALAQYRCGRQGDALRSLNRARRVLAEEVGLDPSNDLVELERAILAQEPNLAAREVSGFTSGECPYRGLGGYDVDDADEFFGRERATEECLRRLSSTGFLAIVGPSGCGKSSLARAGVAATLRRRGHDIAVLTPGEELPRALDEIPAGTALVVDQLEDLFTTAIDQAQRTAVVAHLAVRVATAPVVVTLRSDHLDAVAENADFAALVESSIYLLRPMDEADLRAAIEGPATRAGLRLEPGLVDLLVRDVIDQPGALPLLSHALTEVWGRREGRVLTAAAYRAVGGVQGAVGQTADLAFDRLPPEGRRIARELFLRLVTIADGEPMSQRVDRRDIGIDAPHAAVIDVLTRARLLTVDEATVQVAHESLARAWPRLRAWLDEDREGQRILVHLTSSALGWEALGRDDAELYRGARLRATEEWDATAHPTLTRGERAFLDASIAQRNNEEEDLRARADAQVRANKRLRRLLAAVATALVVAMISAGVAVAQSNRATRESSAARTESREAVVRGLVGQASGLRGTRRDLAVLLALAAYRMAPGEDTFGALMSAVNAESGLDRTIDVPGAQISTGVLLPNGTAVATVDTHQGVELTDIQTGKQIGQFPPVQDTDQSNGRIAVSHDGRYLALATIAQDGPSKLTMWDLATRKRRYPDRTLTFLVGSVAFSPDDRLVAIGGGDDGITEVRDAASGRLLRSIPGLASPPDATLHSNTVAVAFAPNGNLVTTSLAGPVRVVDPQSGRELRRIGGPEQVASSFVALSPDGRTIFGSGIDGISRWDLSSGRLSWVQNSDGQCDSIMVAETIGALLCAQGGHVTAFDLASGGRRGNGFDDQGSPIVAMNTIDNGNELIEAGANTLTFWRLDGGSAMSRLVHNGANLTPQEYLSDGELLVTHPISDGPPGIELNQPGIELLDPQRGTIVDTLTGITTATGLAQPAHRLAVTFADGTGGFYDTAQHQRVPRVRNRMPFIPDAAVAAGQTLIESSGYRIQGIAADGRLVAPAFAHPGGRNKVLATTDGSRVFTFQAGHLIQREANGTRIQTVPIAEITDAIATRDRLVVSTPDGQVHTFDAWTLQDRGDLTSTPTQITYMVSSLDGSRIVLVGADGTLRLADPTSRSLFGNPMGAGSNDSIDNTQFNHSSVPALNADGTQLAIGTGRGIIVYDFDPAHVAAAACRIAGRNLTRAEWNRYVGTQTSYTTYCN